MYREVGLRRMLVAICLIAAACGSADDEETAPTAAGPTATVATTTVTTAATTATVTTAATTATVTTAGTTATPTTATVTTAATTATTADEPEPGPDCSFLTCDTEVPPGVEGTIGTLIPGPPCVGGETPVIVPEDAAQGDVLYICVPRLVTRLAPYTVTIVGPSGVVVFDETRETPVGIPPIEVAATPGDFPIGNYQVNVTQVQDFLIDSTTNFSIQQATTPRVLVEETSPSMIRLWIAGADPNADTEVDFYLLATGEECTYRGTETVPIDGTGVGSSSFEVAGLRPGAYFAFLRSEKARQCVREDFRIS